MGGRSTSPPQDGLQPYKGCDLNNMNYMIEDLNNMNYINEAKSNTRPGLIAENYCMI